MVDNDVDEFHVNNNTVSCTVHDMQHVVACDKWYVVTALGYAGWGMQYAVCLFAYALGGMWHALCSTHILCNIRHVVITCHVYAVMP